jgi:hypothetical protein
MTQDNQEVDPQIVKELLITTREKLFNTMLINVELETALKIEREKVRMLTEAKDSKN